MPSINNDGPSREYARAAAVVDELIKSGWHPDRIIEVAVPMLRDHPDYPESAIHDWIWGDYEVYLELGQTRNKQRPIASEIKRYIEGREGDLYLAEIYEALQIINPQDKAAAQMALSRLAAKNGPLEKSGKGHFRVRADDCAIIDIFDPDQAELNIKYPLGIHEFFITRPKNIIVVAGESDAGKSAFVMNFAALNKDSYPVSYFSSEMGNTELKARLIKYNRGTEFWRNVDFRERSRDFADVIRPDSINIIDFLEIHEDFYLIGKYIKDIFDKLNKGIAIIALQKDEGRDLGRGRGLSIEKARLYLTMEKNNRTKIVKCKNWRDDMYNPNGLCCRWKLAAGIRFLPEKNSNGSVKWIKEGEPDATTQNRAKTYNP